MSPGSWSRGRTGAPRLSTSSSLSFMRSSAIWRASSSAAKRPDHSLQPTALTHEAFLRLFGTRQIGWQNRAHFFAAASQLMRRILVEHARKRQALKRGGTPTRVTLEEANTPAEPLDVDIVALHEALTKLEEVDPRQSRIVELRYFGGLNLEETAEVLSVSPATVKRDWRVAKLWLRRALEGAASP